MLIKGISLDVSPMGGSGILCLQQNGPCFGNGVQVMLAKKRTSVIYWINRSFYGIVNVSDTLTA